MAEPVPIPHADLPDLVAGLMRREQVRPFLLGIAGPPASGKSTLSQHLADELSKECGFLARHCPMDGFHLSTARLEVLGLRTAKGRIDTFNADALLAAVQSLTARKAFWWPTYSRTKHEPVADGLWITGQEDVCIVEGNYLFAETPVWNDVARQFRLRIFVDAPDAVLQERLRARHLAGGRGPVRAHAKIFETDLPNAGKIRATKHAAEFVVDGAHCR